MIPCLVPTIRLLSQQAESRTWHCLFTNTVRLKGNPSTRRDVNQNSSRTECIISWQCRTSLSKFHQARTTKKFRFCQNLSLKYQNWH